MAVPTLNGDLAKSQNTEARSKNSEFRTENMESGMRSFPTSQKDRLLIIFWKIPPEKCKIQL